MTRPRRVTTKSLGPSCGLYTLYSLAASLRHKLLMGGGGVIPSAVQQPQKVKLKEVKMMQVVSNRAETLIYLWQATSQLSCLLHQAIYWGRRVGLGIFFVLRFLHEAELFWILSGGRDMRIPTGTPRKPSPSLTLWEIWEAPISLDL